MGGGADDDSLALGRELELEHGSGSKRSSAMTKTEEGEGGEDAIAETMELDGRKVERSGGVTPSEGRTDDDHHGEEVLTTPASRVRPMMDEPLGKKLALPRNLSQKGSELQQHGERRQGAVAEPKLRHHNHHQAQRPPRPSSAGNSTPVTMSIDDDGSEKMPAGPRQQQGLKDVPTNETKGEGHGHSGKQVPRYGSENLDSSPDYGRREAAPQGNSRHICKYCAKEFASGRALGGHMRAHGSLTVEEGPAWTTTAGAVEKQLATGLAPHSHSSPGTDSRSGSEEHEVSNANGGVKQQEGGGGGRNSKRSRNNHNGKEIQAGRSGGRRSKHKRKRQITPKNSDDEVEDIKQSDRGRKNAAVAATAPMTGVEPSVSSGDDGNNNEEGTDEENGGGVTDGAAAANNNNSSSSNVCNVCDQEFENGKQLNSHKKSHDLYGLRRNPKRSRRFMDQDYTAEAAAVTVPAKKTSSMFTPEGEEPICSECHKRFQSWKALFGHMRCHPERQWRGIHRPDAARDRQQQQPERTSSSADRQFTSSRRRESSSLVALPAAEILPNSPSAGAAAASHESDSEFAPAIESSGHGKGVAAAVASDNDSDTESIEAAYMNGERQPASSTWIWMTGKRSKRSRQTVKSLQIVSKTAPVPAPPTPAENNEMAEHETAMGLMMLARKQGGGGDESWFEAKRSNDNNRPASSMEPRYRRPSTLRVDGKRKNSGSSSQLELPKETRERAFSETEGEAQAEADEGEEEENEHEAEEVVDDDDDEDGVDDEDEPWADADAKNMEYKTEGVPLLRDVLIPRPRRHLEEKAKAKLEAADNASLCEENDELGGDVSDAGELGGGSSKPKYQCNSCKRSFKSHQALGGHRASHKKVKGCYARTNVSDSVGVQENLDDEEMMSEEFSRSDEQHQQEEQPQQPINSPQNQSQTSEDEEKEPQLSTALAKENSDEMTNNTNNGISSSSRSKSKGHPCTLCGRTFNSGQALGGHKRCHYNSKEATSSEATSSNNTKQQQPQLASAGGSGVSDVATAQQQQSGRGRGRLFKEELTQQVPVVSSVQKEEVNQITQPGRSSSASDDIVQATSSSAGAAILVPAPAPVPIPALAPASAPAVAQSRPVKEKFLDLNLPAPDNDDEAELEAYAIPPADLMCELNIPVQTKIELKGTVEFRSNACAVQGTGSSSSELDGELLEMQRGQPKDDYLSLYHNAGNFSAASLTAEEKSQEIGGGGGQDSSTTPGFRGAEVDFGLRYVRCNICDKHFSTVEALSNHEKTHARILSSVSSGLTPISA